MTRAINHRYEDPLDRIWLACAKALGLRVVREEGAYASTDGRGGLFIATPPELDPDDCLAQMVFHELCHAMVEGPEAFERRDWGLDNESDADLARERACLRTQAYLLRPLGLRRVLGPTTDHRAFYDALGPDPLADPEGAGLPDGRVDGSIALARRAIGRAAREPFAPHLAAALEATARIAELTAPHAKGTDSLFAATEPRVETNRVGRHLAAPGSPAAGATCGSCGFAKERGGRWTCAKTLDARRRSVATRADEPACDLYEPEPRCEDCGACCREAYDQLELAASEPFVRRHPELVVLRDGRRAVPRPSGRCPPLAGDGIDVPFSCGLYDERPQTCRDFTRGSAHCLDARRRVGRSL